VEEASIRRRFGWEEAYVINDLVATALAIPVLAQREVVLLKSGKKRTGENIGLVAPGTGLGMALLVQTKSGYTPVASEGGHADFGPNNDWEARLWHHLRKRFGHVSTERVLSGPGLNNLYMWLRDSGAYREPAWLKSTCSKIEPAQAITNAAVNRRTPLAVASLEMFVSILGAAAGNLALTGMTTGGIYLGGGIPPKILPFLKSPFFMEAFMGKGRFRPLLEKIPVHLILNDKAALMGAAVYAFCSD
jgi:glucokinase